MIMKNTWFIIFCLFSSLRLASAQADSSQLSVQETPDLQLILRKSDQDVLLRWAATSAGVWFNSLSGYVLIERTTFDAFQNIAAAKTDTLVRDLRPWTEAELEAAMQQYPNNDYLVMAGQSIHGEWESIQPTKELDMATILARREELNHKYSTALFIADMNTQAAEAMGLFYKDSQVPKGQYLLYRLTIFGAQGQQYRTTALYNPNFDLVATPHIDDAEAADGYVRLTWDRTSHEQHFTAYHIERSADNIRFERLNKQPYINAVDEKQAFGIPPITYLADAENEQPYYYRIIGIDAFGQESEPSASVLLAAKDLMPPIPPIRPEAELLDNKSMQIKWEQAQTSEDMTGYRIKRSRSFDGLFLPISELLPSSTRQFEDRAPSTISDNYYQICAIDRSGNEGCSAPAYGFIKDQRPPPTPTGLRGFIDTLGIVHLQWPLSTAPDLRGYHIYTANDPKQPFQRLNKTVVQDTTWQDTLPLNTLTEEIYYRIAAVDRSANVSTFSDYIRLAKPDTIAPTPAIFNNYRAEDTGIYLAWVNSNSRDVVSHQLERRSLNSNWELLRSFQGLETSFLDQSVAPATAYEYRIRALDDAGLYSPIVNTLQVNSLPKKLGELPEIAIQASENGPLTLALRPGYATEEVAEIWIYKAINSQAFQRFSRQNPALSLQISDADYQPGNTYQYRYRLLFKDGRKSDYSPTSSWQP